jgi:hypothetical protein
MALDAFTRAVRALDMNLETTNQPQNNRGASKREVSLRRKVGAQEH